MGIKTVLLESLIYVDTQTDQEATEIVNKIIGKIEDNIKGLDDRINTVHSLNYTKYKNADIFMLYMHKYKTVKTDNYKLEYAETESVKIYSNYSQKVITIKNIEEFDKINSKLIEEHLPSLRICSETGEPIQKGYRKPSGWYCSEKYFPKYMVCTYGRTPWKIENEKVFVSYNGIYKDTEITYEDWTQDETLIKANRRYEKMTRIKPKRRKENDMNVTPNTAKPILKGKI